jgi:hypothetical protein
MRYEIRVVDWNWCVANRGMCHSIERALEIFTDEAVCDWATVELFQRFCGQEKVVASCRQIRTNQHI